jgi:hypothetical protein
MAFPSLGMMLGTRTAMAYSKVPPNTFSDYFVIFLDAAHAMR